MKKYTKLLTVLLSLGFVSALEANVKIRVIFDYNGGYVQHRENKKVGGWTRWHHIDPIAGTTNIYDIDTDNNDEYCIRHDVNNSEGSGVHSASTNTHKGGAFVGKTTWDLKQPDNHEIY